MTGIIDYAGLFPPAKLPMDAAIRNYAAYRTEPEAWMLGRFICPAAKLAELAPFGNELFAKGEPFRFSALGRAGAAPGEFLDGVGRDLADIAAFQEAHAGRVIVDAYETRLPPSLDGILDRTAQAFEQDGPAEVVIAYEVALAGQWKEQLRNVAAAIADHNAADGRRRVRRAALKLRCGGVEASAFPPIEQVAFAIAACRDAGVPLKCTAGLHHPVRHHNASVKTKMHGFLNVFGAGVLAHAKELDEPTIRDIIADESADSFAFDDAGFRWKDHRATAEQIETARSEAVLSFGSCSFDEPRDDLRSLGLL